MAAKQATEDGNRLQKPLLLALPDPNSYTSIYTPEERKKALKWGYFESPEYPGWMVNGHEQQFFPSAIAFQAIQEAHQSTHYRHEALYRWLNKSITIPNFCSLLKEVFEACLQNNPNTHHPTPMSWNCHGSCECVISTLMRYNKRIMRLQVYLNLNLSPS